ncbi:hypothetical protein CBS14141_000268 [Malassezia furfur]|nr:hypothetical protein CBS14141_000268 [Malassezia furfur]
MGDAVVNSFRLNRVINEGACEINGQVAPAVLLLERAFYPESFVESMKHGPQEAFSRLETIGQNDVYTWVLGYQKDGSQGGAHSKLTLICPAGNEVVEKYSAHERRMIIETPQLYEKVTEPWIESIPRSKTQWVRNILDGVSESESVLYRDDDPKSGFVLTPDLKWDQRTLSSLYLVAIVKDESLTNLRDLTKEQIPLLKKIKAAAAKVATEKYGLSAPSEDGIESSLRCYIHYMPTFFHLHVHILSVNFISHPGAIVGQAQLLEDVIGLLEAGVDFKKRTLGYQLTEGHALLKELRKYNAST